MWDWYSKKREITTTYHYYFLAKNGTPFLPNIAFFCTSMPAIFRDSSGNVLDLVYGFDTACSVLKAEFKSIKLAMEEAGRKSSSTLVVESNSMLAVKALNSKSKPSDWKSFVVLLFCCNLCLSFKSISFSFVPGMVNASADLLAKWAMTVKEFRCGG